MEFKLFNGEVENLVYLLTNNIWLYHTENTVKESNIRKAVAPMKENLLGALMIMKKST